MTDKTKFNVKALAVVVVILVIMWVIFGFGRTDSQPADGQGTTEVQPQ